MQRYCSTSQSPQRAVAPAEEEEKEEEEEEFPPLKILQVMAAKSNVFIFSMSLKLRVFYHVQRK